MASDSSPPLLDEDGYGTASQPDFPSLKCETGFVVLGFLDGEAICTPIRVFCTLVTMSVTSAWFSRRKSIKMLILFFSHWLSGMIHQLAAMAEATMILVCWTGDSVVGLIKAFKFLELASSNMLAITNLAVCINLALIVSSRRTRSRISSVSSPWLMLLSLAISVGAAAASVPYWSVTVLSGTAFWLLNDDEREFDWIMISTFFLELVVGACMFVIVVCLLLFRMKEIKECWTMYASIRFYFGLTLIGTAVNLAIGICGMIYVLQDFQGQLIFVLSWTFRYIHIALDTIVQYGVLGTRQIDERSRSPASSRRPSRTKSATSARDRRKDSSKPRAGDRKRSSTNLHSSRGSTSSEESKRRTVHTTVAFDNRFSTPSSEPG